VKLQQQYEKVHPDEKAGHMFASILKQFVALRADIKAQKLSDPLAIVTACVVIDERFRTWRALLPSSSYPTEHQVKVITNEVFGTEFFEYESLNTASMWTSYRSVHILVHEMIAEHLLPFSTTTSPLGSISNPSLQRQESLIAIRNLAIDMTKTVPGILGFGRNGQLAGSARASAGLFALWPLFSIGCQENVPHQIRVWSLHRLLFIGHTMGIQQALAAAAVLRKRQELRAWTTIWVKSVMTSQMFVKNSKWPGYEHSRSDGYDGQEVMYEETDVAWTSNSGTQESREEHVELEMEAEDIE